jgi:hypothetical protein
VVVLIAKSSIEQDGYGQAPDATGARLAGPVGRPAPLSRQAKNIKTQKKFQGVRKFFIGADSCRAPQEVSYLGWTARQGSGLGRVRG